MNILKNGLLLALIAIGLSSAEKFSFEGYKIVSLIPTSENHLKLISELQHNQDFDVMNSVRVLNEIVFVCLSPKAFEKYSQVFSRSKMEFKVVNDNIQKKIDLEDESMKDNGKRDTKNIVGRFGRYSSIMSFIDEMVETYPSVASSYVVGKTSENRDLKVLVLKTANSNRGIFIDCGFHAREWISVSSCIWTIDRLLKGFFEGSGDAQNILNKYEIHILPLVNPDGYEYSHSTYRMWRKNRAIHATSPCIGVDLNRNFGYKWMTGGSSSSPCSDVYAGPRADSELETKAVQKAINNKLGYWDAYLTIHTYGQYWLTSWSYSTTVYPPDYNELLAAAKVGANGISSVKGTKYTVGHSGSLFGALSGVSDDWAKGVANVKYAYTLELAPGDSGDSDASFGFALPEDRAPRVGEELFQGVVAFIKHLISL